MRRWTSRNAGGPVSITTEFESFARRLRLLVLTCALGNFSSHAAAQDAPADLVAYEAEFFSQFLPQTALDMVERVPGFTLEQGEDRRGLGGAAGNILIDGRSPAAKGQSLRGLLRRVPARSVERLELLRGGDTSASNAQSVRVNVILRPNPGSGVWRVTLDHAEDGRISPDLDASWSSRIGAAEYRIAGELGLSHQPRFGSEVILGPDGSVEEQRFEERVSDDEQFGLSGELTVPVRGGEVIILGTVELVRDTVTEFASAVPGRGEAEELSQVRAEGEREIGEFSATYSRPLGAWRSETSLLYGLERSEETQTEIELDLVDRETETTLEAETSEETETVLRAVAARDLSDGALRLDGELAFNRLDQDLRLTETEGAESVTIDLPGADTLVEEVRGELGLSRRWDFGGMWGAEVGAAYEYSVLSNAGDFADERELSFFKPSVQISRQLGDDDQLRLRIYRDVSQLDFEDFAAGVELDNENIIAGNADLRPETSWRAELAGDWRFEGGALEVTAFAWDVEDIQDFALFETEEERFDTRGNIGAGSVLGISARFETPLRRVPGARLSLEGSWQDTEVSDPLTGEDREQSGADRKRLSLEFRQDFPRRRTAWGVEYDRQERAPEFRFDEVTEDDAENEVRLWIETTGLGNFKLRVAADNLISGLETRDRRRFAPDRLGTLAGSERREREASSIVSFRLEGVF